MRKLATSPRWRKVHQCISAYFHILVAERSSSCHNMNIPNKKQHKLPKLLQYPKSTKLHNHHAHSIAYVNKLQDRHASAGTTATPLQAPPWSSSLSLLSHPLQDPKSIIKTSTFETFWEWRKNGRRGCRNWYTISKPPLQLIYATIHKFDHKQTPYNLLNTKKHHCKGFKYIE